VFLRSLLHFLRLFSLFFLNSGDFGAALPLESLNLLHEIVDISQIIEEMHLYDKTALIADLFIEATEDADFWSRSEVDLVS
jgi:hypothetical protein